MFRSSQFSAKLISLALLVQLGLVVSNVSATTALKTDHQRYGVFEVPLVAFTKPTPAQTTKLNAAITAYAKAGDATRIDVLQRYLDQSKTSPWRASLLVNIALVKKRAGYFSHAIALFQQARKAAAQARTPQEMAVGVKATGELLDLYTRFGQQHNLQTLLGSVRMTPATGAISELIDSAQDGLWEMQHEPQNALRCGIVALGTLLSGNDGGKAHALDNELAGQHGTSLTQLVAISERAGTPAYAIRREIGQPIPVPSVVHWRVGHYATILKQKGNHYLINDPAMDREYWMTREAINAESSGHYLIVNIPKPASSWRLLAKAESDKVLGGGNTPKSDPGETATDSPTECDNTCGASTGMPRYRVHSMLVSLNIVDTPVSYTPAVGPAVPVTVSYSQREAFQPATFTYFNFGHKWNFNWLSFVQDDPQIPGRSVRIFLPGGGSRTYSGYNAATGTFATEARTGAHLVRIAGSTVQYERRMPDGSKYVYAMPDSSLYYPRRVFLTQVVDTAGNAVTLTYDDKLRLTTLTDAIGQVTTFHYDNAAFPLRITSVTDPFDRSAIFTYDTSGRLYSIADAIGMTSSFTYKQTGTFINSMTTPYGTTKFSSLKAGTTRWVDIADPKGEKERVEFRHSAPYIPFSDSPVPTGMNLFNRYINSRNTYYWDKEAMKRSPRNYRMARIRHWYHVRNDIRMTAGVIESVKNPLERRIWYNYPGQKWGGENGTLDKPSIIGRVLPDGSTQLIHKSYNAFGKLTKIVDPNGREIVQEYADNQIDLLRIKRKNAMGYDVLAEFTYNEQHRPLTYTGPNGHVTKYTYNANGQRTSITNALGQTTQYHYDDHGYLAEIIDPNNNTVARYTYDNIGRIATISDAAGYTREFEYDNLNRQTKVTYPDGSSEVTNWDKLDVANRKDRFGDVTVYAHDEVQNLLSVTDPSNHATEYGYFDNGQLASVTDAKGNSRQIERDIQRRKTRDIYADGTHTDYQYDNNGRLWRSTDTLNSNTDYAYLHDNRLGSVTDRDGHVTTYDYDSYTGELTSQTSPDSGNTTYHYDLNGNLKDETDAKGQTTTYDYDALNRVKTVTYADGKVVTYQYDTGVNGIGHLAQVTEESGTTTFEYDVRGLMVAKTQTDAQGHTYTLHFTYTDAGLPKDVTYPSGALVTYTYDRDRVVSIHVNGQSLLTDIQYAPFGGISGWTWGNGTASSWGYDELNHLNHYSVATDLRDLTYDKVGNITGATGAGADQQFGYDKLWRLTSATDPQFTLAYDYDANGNRQKASVDGVEHVYTTETDSNRLAAIDGVSYQYDPNGNVLNDGKHTYTFDARNRLVMLDGNAAQYDYNAFGQRVSKLSEQSYTLTADLNHDGVITKDDLHTLKDLINQHLSPAEADLNQDGVVDQHDMHCIANWIGDKQTKGAPDCHVGDTITHTAQTHYVYQNSELLGEYDNHGQALQEIIWMSNMPVGILQNGQLYQVSDNQLGAPVAVTNSSGSVVWRWEPKAFGDTAANENPDGDGTKFTFNLRFPGQYYDTESGLHYNYYRYYDPSTGRYITSDPIGLWGGLNTYAYVEGNPLRFIDPQGLAIGDFPPPPPGYDPKTWTQGQYQNNGRIYLRDPSGRIWIVHPEDKGHWRHWDKRGGGDDGRWPPNSKKTWPNQKKPAKPDQCKEDPSGDAPPWEPLDPEEIAIEGDPILDPLMPFSPFNPFNPNWGRGPSPVRVPPIRVPVFVP